MKHSDTPSEKHGDSLALHELALYLSDLFGFERHFESQGLSGAEILKKVLEELEPKLADVIALLTRTASASIVPDETRKDAAVFLYNLARFVCEHLDGLAGSAPDLLRGIAADDRTAPVLASKGKKGAQRQKEFLQLIELAKNVPEPQRKKEGGVIPAIAQCILDAVHEARRMHEDNSYLLGECLAGNWAAMAHDPGNGALPAIEESCFWEFEQPGELPDLDSRDGNPQEIWKAYCRRIFLKIFGDAPDKFCVLFKKEIKLSVKNTELGAGTSANDAILQRFDSCLKVRLKGPPKR